MHLCFSCCEKGRIDLGTIKKQLSDKDSGLENVYRKYKMDRLLPEEERETGDALSTRGKV